MKLTEIDTNNVTDDIIKKVLFSYLKRDFVIGDCLIIFGCHIKVLLDERLNHALEILKSKKINKILLTGGVGVNGDFNESLYMKDVLLKSGISEDMILIEDKSTTTEENIINLIHILKSNNLIENKNIVLVSNHFHLRRVGMEMRKQLENYNFNLFYEYPDDSLLSYDKIIADNNLRNLATNQVLKIINFINDGIIDDEEIELIIDKEVSYKK